MTDHDAAAGIAGGHGPAGRFRDKGSRSDRGRPYPEQHLARTFRRREGLAPHQFIIRERVNAARAMIAKGDVTLAEAALSAGFGDHSQMTATFRRVLGVTPGSLRRRSANADRPRGVAADG